ncbi:hypothetical protein FisN_24Hu065 [Fistulifera solaris]|uniref:DDE Tnp4 domain-containing protein n=1 Tax=Fistulifera solaris TaxID=1519565 RepID=A0A1Z5JEQ8_FISSO|nr:hypothetical protein FisN_24Hu065 [Fistulifera solaris]|eukprot:GAX12490.1 hypothetical protein FisN_24Hu065 [Fistulifera solaris]
MDDLLLLQIIQLQFQLSTLTVRRIRRRRRLQESKTRDAKIHIARKVFNQHLYECRDSGFANRYHMTYSSFQYLVHLLGEKIVFNKTKSLNSTGDPSLYISPEMVVAMSLRFLGGEKEKSLEDVFGPRRASIDRVLDKFFNACLNTPELWLQLPKTKDELTAAAVGFNEHSDAKGVFYGVVGCLDGYMIAVDKPKSTVCRDYWSEHYGCYGINTQCMCDPNLRFTYANVAAPGKTSDSVALDMSPALTDWLRGLARDELDKDFYIVADSAYPLTNYSLIPFSGNGLTEAQKNYNFFLSQLRIRIEMTFGRLTTKYRIFRGKMAYGHKKVQRIFMVSCMLHNFVIDNDNVEIDYEDRLVEHEGGLIHANQPQFVGDEVEGPDPLASSSVRRGLLVQLISEDPQLVRPLHNLIRNANNNH